MLRMMRAFPRLLLLGCLCFASALAQAVPAQGFTLPNLDGKTVSLQDYRGKIVYLDFWASWCVPCRTSFPWMSSMHDKYAKDGLVIIGVTVDASPATAKQFLQRNPANFVIAHDRNGKIADMYKISAMPTSFLIDRQGNIIDTHYGFSTKDQAKLEARIKAALTAK